VGELLALARVAAAGRERELAPTPTPFGPGPTTRRDVVVMLALWAAFAGLTVLAIPAGAPLAVYGYMLLGHLFAVAAPWAVRRRLGLLRDSWAELRAVGPGPEPDQAGAYRSSAVSAPANLARRRAVARHRYRAALAAVALTLPMLAPGFVALVLHAISSP
jgi:hypothetical protein